MGRCRIESSGVDYPVCPVRYSRFGLYHRFAEWFGNLYHLRQTAVAAGGLYAAGITRAQPYHRGLYAPTQPLSIGVALPEGERSECILYPLFGSQYIIVPRIVGLGDGDVVAILFQGVASWRCFKSGTS